MTYAEKIIGTERKRSRDERLRKNGFEFFRDDLYEVLKVHLLYNKMAQWLSWLERRPVTAEVAGSSPAWVVYGILAQLGEHLPYKQRVIGSSPIGPISDSFVPMWLNWQSS